MIVNLATRSMIFLFVFLLTSCTFSPPRDETYSIKEFVAESDQIQKNRDAVLKPKEQEFSDETRRYQHRVGEGDILSIAFYSAKRSDKMHIFEVISQRNGFIVTEGKISLPGLQPIFVEGLTLKEIKEILNLAYQNEVSDAQIFVDFKTRKTKFIQLVGAKNSMIPVHGEMSLYEVLSLGHIPPQANLSKSYCMRGDEKLPVDFYKLIHEGDETQNILMKGGDKIFLASERAGSVFVTGEVPHPLVIPAIYGFITLREALALSGGIPYTGNTGSILVVRSHDEHPKIFSFSWKEMLSFNNDSLLLIPGDTVVISERPLTGWNRFVNQLQPSNDCIQTTLNTCSICRGRR